MAENGADLEKHLVDSNGGNALLAFDNAGFEAAAPAIGLVIYHAVLSAIGKPDAGSVTSGEDGNTGGLDCGGKMHGAAVMADEDPGSREDGGALARGERAAEVDDPPPCGGSVAPAVRSKLARVAFMRRAAEDKGVAGIKDSEFTEQGAPVFAAPVLRLDFGAYTDGDNGLPCDRTEGFVRASVFFRREFKVPAFRVVEASISEFGQIAGQAGAFGFIGLLRLLPQVPLHVFVDGHSDKPSNAAEAEKARVSVCGFDASGSSQIDKDLRAPADELPPEREQFERVAGPYDVLEVAADETAASKDLGGSGSFDIHREVGQHAAFGLWKSTRDEV